MKIGADLHLHLDGSISEGLTRELYYNRFGKELPVDTKLSINTGMPSLTEYLKYFEIPISVLKDNLYPMSQVAEELVARLFLRETEYAEIRFAPQILTDNPTVEWCEKIIRAVEYGLLLGRHTYGIETRLIICMMRGLPYSVNEAAYKAALEDKKSGLSKIVAIDLAGDERTYSGEEYRDIFLDAKKQGLHITMHAGENRGPESIKMALDFGAERMGHCLSLYQDKDLMQEIAKRKICIESCPTSNFQTGAMNRYGYHIKEFLEAGIPVTINTDNMTVSNTWLSNEYDYVKTLGISDEELEIMINNSYLYSFND